MIQGTAKEEMLKVFRQGIEREENDSALLPQSKQHITAAKYTIDIMAEAPAIVFVVNSLGKSILTELTPEKRVYEICNNQLDRMTLFGENRLGGFISNKLTNCGTAKYFPTQRHLSGTLLLSLAILNLNLYKKSATAISHLFPKYKSFF